VFDQTGHPTYATNISQVSMPCSKFSGSYLMDLFKVFRQAYIKLSLACLSQGEKSVHIDSEDVLSALNFSFVSAIVVSVPLAN